MMRIQRPPKFRDEVIQFHQRGSVDSVRLTQPSLTQLRSQHSGCRFFVVSGASGVGKSTVIAHLLASRSLDINWSLLRRVTTRPPRSSDLENEIDCVAEEKFRELYEQNELLYVEHYARNGASYGVTLDQYQQSIDGCAPNTAFLVVGTIGLARALPHGLYAYLFPPSLAELRRRLDCSAKDVDGSVFAYGVTEISEAVQSLSALCSKSRWIAAVVNETDRVAECASKLETFVISGSRICEFPSGMTLREKH